MGEPGFAEHRVRTRGDLVPRRPHRERETHIRKRKPPPRALRPLDEPDTTLACPLAQAERFDLGAIVNTIEIDVEERQGRCRVELEQRVGRAANGLGDTECAQKTPRKRGLSGTELTTQIERGEAAVAGWPRTGELPSKVLRVLRGVGARVHVSRIRG